MELLCEYVIFLGKGCEFLCNPREFLWDGDQPSYELGQKGQGRCL